MNIALRPGPRRLGILAAAALAVVLPASALAQSPEAGATAAPLAPSPAGTFDGTWKVDPSIGSFDYAAGDFTGSWVGYRVQEELVGMGGVTAVGRTPDISGSITLSGTAVTAADLVADLTTLQSDEPFRDGQLGRQGIQTDQFPTATFVLTQPIELGTLPAEGQSVNANALGDLTLHGVTRNVTIPLAAARSGDVISVGGSLTFRWEDFAMERPTSMRVVSLADDVTMELQAFFRYQGAAPAGSPAPGPESSPAA
jgi:polyisoprenoid-binding protein YceI